jgi:protein-S-isoprenylcysteine O-methyltransferase Ste14
MNKMTRWGIGPKFGILTSIYSALMYLIHSYFPENFSGFHTLGIVLISVGFCLFIYPAVTIDKYFNEGRLRTKGLYAICRHPIYSAWIVLIIPGIVLYWGSVIGLTIPIVAYLIFRNNIHIEEDYLIKMFGLEYINYKDRVNAVFPKIF